MNTDKHRYLFGQIVLGAMAILLTCAPLVRAQGAQGNNGESLPEVLEAIQKARVTTRILYITAHPDDEPGALLAYLARGLHADVALLALTRGEGGQNALGPEQAPQLGIIRTDELSDATRVYGTRLYFTRAKDFGFSKTAEETMQIWGDQVLEDMVRVIRTFRPHVIINNWGGVRTGHGNHQASGLLTPKAYAMAGDPQAFPEQLKEGLPAWKADALLQLSRGNETSGAFSLPVGDVSALWGKNWAEIGIEGYLNHRTQGVGGIRNSPFFRRSIGLVGMEGAKPTEDLLAAGLTTLAERFPNLQVILGRPLSIVDADLSKAFVAAQRLDWTACVQELFKARDIVAELIDATGNRAAVNSHAAIDELDLVLTRIDSAAGSAAGLRTESMADRAELVAGEAFQVTVNWQTRTAVAVEVNGAKLALPEGWSVTKAEKAQGGGTRFTVSIPQNAKPIETGGTYEGGIYPWPAAMVHARLQASIGGHEYQYEAPVTATRVTSVSAETRPLLLVPAVTLTLEPKLIVVASGENQKSEVKNEKQTEREIVVRVRHYSTSAEKITVGITASPGLALDGYKPAYQDGGIGGYVKDVEFNGAGDQLVRFLIKPFTGKAVGKYELSAWARRAPQIAAMCGAVPAKEEEFRTSLEPLVTLPTRMWSEPAVARVHVMDVTVPPGLRVGYVAADNDLIPPALREIGVQVDLLDEAALAFGNLSKYDAIAIGIRAYELRSDLARANQRLLDYAAAGGTLLVQYQREGVWNAAKPSPFPATGSGQRTTYEDSPVRIIDAKHPLLNFPNAIGPRDFEGWVQERGLYYWSSFDAKYTAVLAMKDPGEQEALGALVTAPVGKGVYIYTGLSFFRQLPEGVAGAYRLFVNLLSQGKKKN